MQSLKWLNNLSSFPKQTIQYHSYPSLYPDQYAEEAEIEQFYKNLQDLLINTQNRCPFHYRGLECKSMKSRDTLSKRQIWPWSTKWSRAKANRVLSRECTSYSKHPLPTTQEKTLHMDITIVVTKIRLIIFFAAKIQKLYTVSKNKTSN